MKPDTAARALPLAQAMKDDFDSETRRRGEFYAAEGRVRLAYVGRDEILAAVQGTRLYEVSLHPSGRVVGMFCSCPYFELGFPCKHVWAVALKVDEKNG